MSRHTTIPEGVRNLAWTRTLRYIGWGFGDPLIPILIMAATGSYAEAGLIRSSYDVTLLLVLPVLGVLAERYSAKWLVVVGLLLYPFVSFAYVLAGITGTALFFAIARALNGITWGLDSTGIDTYFRRMTPSGSLSSSFGFLDALSDFGYMAAALSSIWLVKFIPIPGLLLLIAPTSLIALIFALRAKTDHPALAKTETKLSLRDSYKITLKEWAEWGTDLRILAALVLFTEVVAVLIEFFIPIDIYLSSGNLTYVILFTVVIALPSVFGYALGQLADHRDKPRLAAFACMLMAVVLFALALPIPYALTIFGGLVLGVLIELLLILQRSIATKLTTEDHWGRLDSVFAVVSGISDLAAPPLLGVALDVMGFGTLTAILGAVALLLALTFALHTKPRKTASETLITSPLSHDL